MELSSVIVSGDGDLLKRLLEAGRDVNEVCVSRGNGETALITAIRSGQKDLVPVLLSYSADVNQASFGGHTPLLRAAARNYTETIRLLLEHGADPNAQDMSKLCPLYWCIKQQNMSALKELLRYRADVNASVGQGSTPLHAATSTDNVDITRLLLQEGAKVNAKDNCLETPLFYAAKVGGLEVTQELLEAGADVNVQNADCRNVLHMAATSPPGNVDLVQLLLDHGALINAMDRYGNIPLVLNMWNFVIRPNFSISHCLIQHGSNLNHGKCSAALEWTAVKHGNYDLIKFAVRAGFKLGEAPWIKDILDQSPERKTLAIGGYSPSEAKERERKFTDFIKSVLRNPASLTEQSRVVIRDQLRSTACGKSIYCLIQKLPLPQVMLMYLLLEDE